MSNDQQPPGGSGTGPEDPSQPGYGQTPPPQPDYGQTPPPQPGYGQAPPPPGYGQVPPPGYSQGPAGYSVGNAFGYGWTKLWANVGPILLAVLAIVVATIVIQLIGNVISGAFASSGRIEYDMNTGQWSGTTSGGFFGLAMILSLLFSAISYAVTLIIQAGIIRGALDITEGRSVDLKEMFTRIDFVQVLIASLIIGAMVFVGLILCVLPGIAVMFFTWFTLWFVIGRQMSAIDALKASFEFTKANAGTLIVFFLAGVAAYIVGALLCGIGLLVAIPVVIIAQAYTFKTLQNEPVAP